MKYFVRILSALLIMAMAFSIVACSDDENETTEGNGTMDFASGTDTEGDSGEPSEEASEDRGTVDLSSYEAPSMETPALNGFVLPAGATITLSTVSPTAAEDSTAVTVGANALYTGSLILVNPQFELKKDPADSLIKMYDHRATSGATGKYKLANSEYIYIYEDAADAFTSLMLAANAKNAKCANILVSEAYRSEQDQTDIFNANNAKLFKEVVNVATVFPVDWRFAQFFDNNCFY